MFCVGIFMNYLRLASALVAVVLLLAGCAGVPEVPFDRSTSGNVHTIGVLTEAYPAGPSAILVNNVGQSFGLIGSITESVMRNNRENSLKDILGRQHFEIQNRFNQTLASTLTAHGFQVVMVPVARETDGKLLEKYPDSFAVQADAYLDISVLGYGYVAASIADSAPYRPFMSARVKLVGARDKSVLMQDWVVYNAYNNPKYIVTLSPDPAYSYPTFDLLEQDPAGTATGLTVAVDKTAGAIAQLLR
jgi:hypothetical protein